ncbi:hypothetical protein COCON_G00039060 [Conger conger]|uniref:LRRNT domain-containing protein n=1 Tax=Conger conger TaxID=82655 RepID=A0A9Q1E065_CONCO|nr:hypothetical protein COCON_G00039060 [Conger conger]
MRNGFGMSGKHGSCLLFLSRMGVILGLLVPLARGLSCPSSCRCDGTFIYCNDRGLTSIPLGIPEDATILYLQNNRINSAGIPGSCAALCRWRRSTCTATTCRSSPPTCRAASRSSTCRRTTCGLSPTPRWGRSPSSRSCTWTTTPCRPSASRKAPSATATTSGCSSCRGTT